MENLQYQLIRSDRKTIAIQVRPDGTVIVRAPRRMPAAAIQQFVADKRGWIESHLPRQVQIQQKFTPAQLRELAAQAKGVLPERVAYYAGILGVTYGTITIRSQHTRWGSCSSKGNLNFNCLLMLTPDSVVDYVVVHELCHRKEMNHSARFWALVEKILPDYRESKGWLKENGKALIARLN